MDRGESSIISTNTQKKIESEYMQIKIDVILVYFAVSF